MAHSCVTDAFWCSAFLSLLHRSLCLEFLPPLQMSAFCQSAFRHHEGRALSVLVTVVLRCLCAGTAPGWHMGVVYWPHRDGMNAAPLQNPSCLHSCRCHVSTSWMAITPSSLGSQLFVSLCYIVHRPWAYWRTVLGLFFLTSFRSAYQGAFLIGDLPEVCVEILDI